MDITVLVGNPKPDSRTMAVAAEVARRVDASTKPVMIDLAQLTDELLVSDSAKITELVTRVAASDVLIVASPTYKATYTGLLKVFLDRYNKDALKGVIAIPVMTGADMGHSLAPEVHLRPLLVELGASVPTRGLYLVMSDMDRMTTAVEQWATDNLPAVRQAAARTT